MARSGARRARRVFWRRGAMADEEVLVNQMNQIRLSYEPINRFEDLELKGDLLRGIYARDLERPAICQQTVIRPMIQGRDVICQAQSGMGKTAAFCISILQRLDLDDPMGKALVLAPTRELAEQILGEFRAFGQFMNVKCIACIGGGRFTQNVNQVHRGDFHVAVGTLGRITALLEDEYGLDRDSIKMFVIDEADKMITDSSFRPDMKFLIECIAPDAQVILTSATMPSCALDRAHEFMSNPFSLHIRNDQLTLDGIRQFYVDVGDDGNKLGTLSELFPYIKSARGITFCNTRKGAEKLARKMTDLDHKVDVMTGNMSQDKRSRKLARFRSRSDATILIASDLLGRGVDIHHVQLVINYDFPLTREEYIHRVGRAGRFGKRGVSITFLKEGEFENKLRPLEAFYATRIVPLPDMSYLMRLLMSMNQV